MCVCPNYLYLCYSCADTGSILSVMASADILPRLQQRALEADQIIGQLKTQLQQLKQSSAASSKSYF